jgi:long-chain-fatty-acyl-CoA reductase
MRSNQASPTNDQPMVISEDRVQLPEISLPLVVQGKRIERGGQDPGQCLAMPMATARLPALTPDLVVQLTASTDRHILEQLQVQDILAFLNRVGRLWKNKEFNRRRLYVRQLQEYCGYSEAMASLEADLLASLLVNHARAWDQLDAELGSRFLLDEWIRREDSYIRAFPQGLTVHILAGNVPTSGVLSIVRALLTKNAVIAKCSGSDPLTPLMLALSMQDVDPEHPVTRAISVVYWPKDDEVGNSIMAQADGVCVWGGSEALEWARKHTQAEVAFLPFGPKRSFAVIADSTDLHQAALALAHDVCLYDQRACFSIQQVFVCAPMDEFLRELHDALIRYETLLPEMRRTTDDVANRALSVQSDEFLGGTAVCAPGWTVVETPPLNPWRHPLGRYLYVHHVEHLEDVSAFVDGSVQTVAIWPWRACLSVRDRWAQRGISRIVELGLANLFRTGSTHDAYYPLGRLVRIVASEMPSSTHGKGFVVPIDQTESLANREFIDLVQ